MTPPDSPILSSAPLFRRFRSHGEVTTPPASPRLLRQDIAQAAGEFQHVLRQQLQGIHLRRPRGFVVGG